MLTAQNGLIYFTGTGCYSDHRYSIKIPTESSISTPTIDTHNALTKNTTLTLTLTLTNTGGQYNTGRRESINHVSEYQRPEERRLELQMPLLFHSAIICSSEKKSFVYFYCNTI